MEIFDLIIAVQNFGLNYIFVDKGMLSDNTLNDLKKLGYSVVVGQGEVARIKISW